MQRLRSLRYILPLMIFTIVIIFVVLGMTNGIAKRKAFIDKTSIEDIKREVASLSRIAHKSLIIDAQILEDSITQKATDPRTLFAAAINSKNKILFSTDMSLRGKTVDQHLPFYNQNLIDQSLKSKTSSLEFNEAENLITAVMSFTEPSENTVIRSQNKGYIILVYDTNYTHEEIIQSVLTERSLELILSILFVITIIILLNRYVISPLSSLQKATRLISQGDYDKPVKIVSTEEINFVSDALNKMALKIKEDQFALEDQNLRTQNIIDNVVDGIITMDIQGNILSFNQAAEIMFEYDAADIVGKNISILMPEPNRSNHGLYVKNYLDGNQSRTSGSTSEVEALSKSGKSIPIEIRICDFEFQGKKVFLGILRDISERAKVERLKNEFISTVSHELRTPLTALNGSIRLVASGVIAKLPTELENLIDTAERNANRLLSLVDDLLDMEKIMAGKMTFDNKVQELLPIVNDAIQDNLSYAKQYHVKIMPPIIEENIFVFVDNKRLIQVLSNYVSNACKFSDKDGHIEINIYRDNDWVRVSVKDHGSGIPEEFKDTIFQKFSQADNSNIRRRGGTGLGLSISKELIQNMSGRIGFESYEGKGSTFYFDLPIHKQLDKKVS